MTDAIYPELKKFLDVVCYFFLTNDLFREKYTRLGIRFATLPETLSTLAAAKAQKLSFEVAKHECNLEISALSGVEADHGIVPRDDVAFMEKLNELLEAQRIYELCLEGLSDPIAAKEKIRNFQESLASKISYGPLEALLQVYMAEWAEKEKAGESKVLIQGFEKLSEMIGGFNPGRAGIALADTGYGKTNLALQLALQARWSLPTLYINQEMSYSDITKRIATLENKIKHREFYQKIRNQDFVRATYDAGEGFYLTDGFSLSVNQIKGLIRSLSQEKPIRFVVIDYDQCLDLKVTRETPEWKALQNALTDFDNFSREIGCFILVLAQVNREGEISGSHRSKFKSHCTLHFFDHPDHGPVIKAEKNRHGIRGQMLRVDYDTDSSQIRELEILAPEKPMQKPKRTVSTKNISRTATRTPYAD